MNWLRIISFLLFTPACGCGGKPAIPVTLDEICRQPKDAVVMVEGYLISSNQTAATSDKETTTQKNYQLLLVSQPNITGTGGESYHPRHKLRRTQSSA